MHPFYYKVKSSFNPLKDMSILESFDKEKSWKYSLPLDHASEDLLSFERGPFSLSLIEVFVTKKFDRLGCHIDADCPAGSIKLNFRYGDSDSHMQWMEIREIHAPKSEYISDNLNSKDWSNPTLVFNDSKMNIICSAQIDTPTVVNVSLPHGLNNEESRQPLITVATIFDDESGHKMTMDDALKWWNDDITQ